MKETHQAHTQTRIRVQHIAGRVALVIGTGLLIYGLTGTGVLPTLVVTKPDFTCSNAPARTAPMLERKAKEQLSIQLDGASRELWRNQQRHKTRPDAAATAAIRRSLSARKEVLVRTMRANPEAAAAALLTKAERSRLSHFAVNCLESLVTYQGNVQVTHLDDFVRDDGSYGEGSVFQYTLTTKDGAEVQLHIAHAEALDMPSGSTIRVRGYQIGNDVLLDAAPLAPAPSTDFGEVTVIAAASAPALTTYRAAVIMVYFSDDAQPVSPTVSGVSDLVNSTIDGYYQENSYGKVGFDGDIFGWYQIPIASAQCDYGDVGAAAITAADPDIDFTQYTHLITIFRSVPPNCPFGGVASLSASPVQTGEGRRILYTSYVSSVNAFVIGHELGHNLGNHHAQYYPCDPPYTDPYLSYHQPECTPIEYGDFYDIMGSLYTGHFTAIHKEITSFFDPGMLEVVPPGSHDYILEPLETATPGLKAVKVLRGLNTVGNEDDYLYVEYRRPIGYDASISAFGPDVFNGAVLHVFGSGTLHSGLFDPTPAEWTRATSTLPVGASYTDPLSGVIVQTTGQTDEALAVTVTTGREDLTGPSVNIAAPGWNDIVSGTIPINVTAGDASGIDRVEFHIGSKVGPPFSTLTSPPYNTTLDTTQLPNGQNIILATAYDQAGDSQGLDGNWFTASRSIIVDNSDAVPPTVTLTTPTSGGAVTSGMITFSADASDDRAIWKVEFYVDGAATPAVIDTTAPYNGSKIIFTLGSHTIQAAAYDLAGNRVDTPVLSFSIVADTGSPTATILTPLEGAGVSGNVHVTFTASDESGYLNYSFLKIDGVQVLFAGTTIEEYWWDSRSVSDGAHQITIQVGDNAGHNFLSAPVTVIVDNSTPVVTLTSPGSGSLPPSTLITATATHGQGVSRIDFYRDGVRLIGSDTTAPYEMTWDTQSVTPGTHTITARAVSTIGTHATSAAAIVTTTDFTPPTVTLDEPLDGAIVDGTVVLSGTAADLPAPSTPTMHFFLDGVTLLGSDSTAPYTLSWNGYAVVAGSHTLLARAIDSNGNFTDSAEIMITVLGPDILAPDAVINLETL